MSKKAVDTGTHFDGACLCGALRFRIAAPTKWCAHCHCSLCQRAHGAAFGTWVGVAVEQFEILAGDTLIWFASTAEARRGFCSRCGSSLLFESRRWPGEIHVVRAALPGEIDRPPSGHAFASSAVSWYHCDDGLPRKG